MSMKKSMKKMFCLILICILCGSSIMAVYADDNKEKSAEAKEAAMAGSEENHAEKTDAPNGTASGESEVADAGIFNYSGFGDDLLQGGNGDDRYYFGIYHGNDTVNDTSGNNQIIFTDGYSLDDYDISLSLDGKLVLTNIYTDDSIILNDFIKYPVNYEFISEDEIVTIGGGESREVIDGTDLYRARLVGAFY